MPHSFAKQRVGELDPEFHRSGFAQSVGAEATPTPQFRRFHQSALNGIVVHVVYLLGMFALAEDIEIIVALLPKGRWQFSLPDRYLIGDVFLSSGVARNALFENLHGHCKISLRGFGNEEMEVLRHDYIPPDNELVFLSDFFEDFEKQITTTGGGEKRLTMITTAGDEVFVAAGMKPLQTFGHGQSF